MNSDFAFVIAMLGWLAMGVLYILVFRQLRIAQKNCETAIRGWRDALEVIEKLQKRP
jgi:hypothetical protein